MAGAAKEITEKRKLATWFHRRLKRLYPDSHCTLDYATPLDLYVATVLSAQCTDARVNQVTPQLFQKCRRPEDYLDLGSDRLERKIQSTGFFRNKAKSILGACARIVEEYEGEIPKTMKELLTLPGVGRKTANVILGTAFDRQEGIVVDTHVSRIAQRLRLTEQRDPVKIEQEMMELFPRKDWTSLAHRLILHGRTLCTARSPKCEVCPLADRCGERLEQSRTTMVAEKRPRARDAGAASKGAQKPERTRKKAGSAHARRKREGGG